jgi:hypothetical protein
MFFRRSVRIGGFAVDFHMPTMFSNASLKSLLRTAPFFGEDSDSDSEETTHLSRHSFDRDPDTPVRRGSRSYVGRHGRGRSDSTAYNPAFDDEEPGNFCSFFSRLFYLSAMVGIYSSPSLRQSSGLTIPPTLPTSSS